MTTSTRGTVGLIGCGDVVGKAAPFVQKCQANGYEVIAVDYKSDPVGLDKARPDQFFDFSKQSDHVEFLRIARANQFKAIYVANPGNAHLTSAIELQHFTNNVIVSKPLDTHVELVSTIQRQEDINYRYLLPKLSVHDHYLNKPGVQFLGKVMPRLNTDHFFLNSIQMYLVEKQSIEEDEPHRLAGLGCGMIFDLAVHMASILKLLVPEGASWGTGNTRTGCKISVKACSTGRFGGTFLGESTVIAGRPAETFGLVEFLVEETVKSLRGHVSVRPIKVLIVVGKGVPVSHHATRDLKAIVMKFEGGYELTLDVDTHQFLGIDEQILKEEGYYSMDLNQKGINSPLIAAADQEFDLSTGNLLQQWGPASNTVLSLYRALTLADAQPEGYEREDCRSLIDRLLRKSRGSFSHWNIPDNLQTLMIGPSNPSAVA